MDATLIRDIADLEDRATGFDPAECFIRLNHGCISRKLISYFPDTKEWWVYHLIDDTEHTYQTFQEMCDNTNIGKALISGALCYEGDNHDSN